MLRRVGTENLLVLGGNLSASGLGVVTFMLLAKRLELAAFGEWSIFLAIGGLVELIRTGFIRQGLVYYLSADKHDSKSLTGSAVLLGLIATLALALMIYVTGKLPISSNLPTPFLFFCHWYPLVFLASLPHHLFTWISHSRKNYTYMTGSRVLLNVIFLLLITKSAFTNQDLHLEKVAFLYLISNVVISLLAIVVQKDLIFSISKANRSYSRLLLDYGKNSLATLAGSNLLRSSDQILIGFFLGPASAGLYSIMIKILDIVDIPVRALLTTAFPVLSRFYAENDRRRFENKFYESCRLSYLVSVPVSLILLIFPDLFVQLLADESFQPAIPLVRIAGIIVLIGPLEKLLGLSLDSTNRPELNARKVWMMVGLNIAGDLLVLYTSASVEWVALVTIINLVLGITYSSGRLSFMRFRFHKLPIKTCAN